MKRKSLASLFLLLHLLLHPLGHAPLFLAAAPQFVSAPDGAEGQGWRQSPGFCLACQTASCVVAPPIPLAGFTVPPAWQELLAPTGIHHSQSCDHSLAARAPPLT